MDQKFQSKFRVREAGVLDVTKGNKRLDYCRHGYERKVTIKE